MNEAWNDQLCFDQGMTQVFVGRGILPEVGRHCRDIAPSGRVLVVTDANVGDRYGEPVRRSLRRARGASGVEVDLVVVPPGDASKSLEWAGRLYDRLAALRVGRDGLVVGVGGGMVTDLAGFVGATWLRGIATVYCPTTLEADVDAGIGGKTGVNHPSGKNLIGVFHHPRLVLIDVACLESLDQRDVIAGMAESIKHAVITGDAFVRWHEEHVDRALARDPGTLVTLVRRNVEIKADVVARDERDRSGIRAFLNFGHTIGHAVEAACGYRYRHGECVGLGMVAACRLSESLGLIETSVVERVVRLIASYGLPTRMDEAMDESTLWDYLGHDKKARGGRLHLVLLDGLGKPVLRSDVPDEAVRGVLADLRR